jgi:hypothetical protein
MIDVLWNTFPRLLEENVNGLLDEAPPTALKAFQLFKTCQNEGLWEESLENFSRHLSHFYARPRADRRKSDFDLVLRTPMPHDVYSRFHLDFRTAAVSEHSLSHLASWAHHVIRVAKKTTAAFASLEIMTKTMKSLVQPAPHSRADRLDFEDFTHAWQKTVFKSCGSENKTEFSNLLAELHFMNAELKRNDRVLNETALRPILQLSPVEIDWIHVIQKSALLGREIPAAALHQDFSKKSLKDLERVVTLYSVSQTSRLPEIVANRDRIRETLLARCEALLNGQAA